MSDVAAPTASATADAASTPPPVALSEEQILNGEGGLSPEDDAVPSSSTPKIVAGKGESAGAVAPPSDTPSDTPPAESAIGNDVEALLAEARLRPVAGETREQAILRISTHYKGRANNHYDELRNFKQVEVPALRQQVEQLRAIMEPMARREYERVVQAQREAAMAAIPDPETQPEQHNAYMLRLLAQQNFERDQREAWERQQQHQFATEEAQVDAVSDFDDQLIGELHASLGADPSLAADYALLSRAGYNSLQMDYPNDPPEKVQELLQLLQLNDFRTQAGSGRAVTDMIRQRAAMMRSLFANGNGNGHAVAPTPAQATTTAATTPTGSATAARLAQETAAARARSVVSPAPPARSAAPTGEGVKLSDIPEDEFVELYLSGRITDEMITAQVGKPRF